MRRKQARGCSFSREGRAPGLLCAMQAARYPTKVYFGKGAAKTHLPGILEAYGPNVLLAYGGGSIQKNGVYEELTGLLKAAGKVVTEFSGIMSNPTYAKVLEGARLARENQIDLILAVGGGFCNRLLQNCGRPGGGGCGSVGFGDGPA